MYVNGLVNNYQTDNIDESVHSGIPKKFYHMKSKNFGNWEIAPWELFIFKDRKIGEGAFSDVYLAKWRETFVVAKVLNEISLQLKTELILREIDIMSKLHHPNIVQFLGFIDNPFIIVMEYIPNNDLKFNMKSLNKSNKINIMKDILKGLSYLHNRRPYSLIHRDIKPTNIILTNSKVAKITDFGLSKFYNITKSASFSDLNLAELYNNELTANVGTERYMAPEIKNNEKYTNKIDIYSTGILLYEMFEGKKYNLDGNNSWFWTPKKIRNIIKDYMICQDPEKRYTALMILKLLNDY